MVRAWEAGLDTDDADQIRELSDLVGPRENKYHISARVRVVRGDPTIVLCNASRRAALVVIGARGQQPYGGLLGSAAQTLLHHSPVPLILVRGLMPVLPGPFSDNRRDESAPMAPSIPDPNQVLPRPPKIGHGNAGTIGRVSDRTAGPGVWMPGVPH